MVRARGFRREIAFFNKLLRTSGGEIHAFSHSNISCLEKEVLGRVHHQHTMCTVPLFDAVMKLINVAPVREATARLGYPDSLTLGIGIVLLVCTVVYVIPRTSILGAILLTGYLGRATATHVRVGEPFYFTIVFGALIWAGLFLRDARLRALIPLRS